MDDWSSLKALVEKVLLDSQEPNQVIGKKAPAAQKKPADDSRPIAVADEETKSQRPQTLTTTYTEVFPTFDELERDHRA